MSVTLVIVESPAKAKTIKKYLGSEFEVLASYGHVRDLIEKEGAVNPDRDFQMKYQLIEKNHAKVDAIERAMKKAGALYLATDPDREGEAISWHLFEILRERQALDGKDVHRVRFYEITRNGVREAVAQAEPGVNEDTRPWVENFTLVTTIFLRLIKMVIAPLVFATLAVGIAKMGDVSTVGRIGLKAFLWFVCASLVSLSLGLVLVNWFEPGVNIGIALPDAGASSGVTTAQFGLQEFILHLVPMSIVDGMARNEILQIVVFSVFFGVACAGVGKPAAVLVDALEGLSYVMLKLTMLVMWFAPLAVFAAVSSAVAKSGLEVLAVYGKFMAEFYFAIIVLWCVLFAAAVAVMFGSEVRNRKGDWEIQLSPGSEETIWVNDALAESYDASRPVGMW